MSKELVTQPTAAPSRKVLMGAIGGVLAAAINHGLSMLVGSDPNWIWLDDPTVRSAVPIIAAAAAGYMFKERASS